MKRIIKLFVILFLVILSSCSNSSNNQGNNTKEFVHITLKESDEYTIKSANPMQLLKGSNAKFKIEFNDKITFNESQDGYFNELTSEFIVPNVQESKEVSFTTRPIGDCDVTIINNESYGSYTITPNRTNFLKGETVTITTTPNLGFEFMCYSYNNPYRSISGPSGMALSFTNEYSFVIEEDITLHINYFTEGLLKMEYDANGGKTIDGEEKLIVDYKITHAHLNPATLLGTYYLHRDEYTLESYNTKPDGTGERIGIGSKVDISHAKDNKITLYAQWVPWTDSSKFDYEMYEDGTLGIVKYIGNIDVDTIVVPNMHQGKIIKEISSYAFEGLNTRKIILNVDLETIGALAINECKNLEELVMFTNILNAYNDTVKNSPLKTVFINSVSYAMDKTNNERDLSAQIEQINVLKNQRVIFVGNSPLRYNHDLAPFKATYPNKDFYMFGTQDGGNFAIPLDILSTFLKSDDKVIMAISDEYMNPNYIGAFTFTYLKHNFDLLTRIDYQNYINMFFSSYVKFIRYMERGLYGVVYNAEQGNPLADNGVVYYGQSTDSVDNVDPSYKPKMYNYQKDEYYTYINRIFENSVIPNENVYITWSPYNKNSITNYDIFTDYENYIKSVLTSYVYVDSIHDNIYTGDCFIRNNSTHLSKEGATKRIFRWIDVIEF